MAWKSDMKDETKSKITSVLNADDQRHAAMIGGDMAGLDRLLGGDLVYIHGSARQDDKQQYLASIASGAVKYLDIKRTAAAVQVYGDTAVVHGHIAIQGMSSGEKRLIDSLFQSVWVLASFGWQMVGWASIPTGKKAQA
ncbi:hypothetical protein CF68_07070 [Cupriavidus sp. SK-4]|nr:hypothetical protein CF68_07070 [Cupriavidus sp. SK-4]